MKNTSDSWNSKLLTSLLSQCIVLSTSLHESHNGWWTVWFLLGGYKLINCTEANK
jgi:hypothetical protein